MEKASVILTIISAALQVATAIANLFNDDESKQKEIEHLQGRIDQLQWELDNDNIVRTQKMSDGMTYMDRMKQAVYETRLELYKNALATGNWYDYIVACYGKVSHYPKLMEASAEKLATSMGNLGYSVDKALGAEKYSQCNDQLKNIAQQQIMMQEQIDAERSKKKSDNDAIAEYERKIEELGQQALDIINDMVEDIIGDTSTGIAEQLADAFFEAFEAGEDAAQAWADKVNDIVKDILKRMLVTKLLEQPLGEIFDKYKAKWFKDGKFQGIDTVTNSMQDFANDLNGTLGNFQDVMDSLPDELKQYFIGNIEDEREASEGGIASASQESVDELNGRATAIQSHTFSISENTKLLVANSSAILHSVMNIETNTDAISSEMTTMRGYIKEVRTTLSDIQLRGLRLSN